MMPGRPLGTEFNRFAEEVSLGAPKEESDGGEEAAASGAAAADRQGCAENSVKGALIQALD